MASPIGWEKIKSILARFTSTPSAGKTPEADESGKIDAGWLPEIPADKLPKATAEVPGVIKVGEGLNLSEDGTLSSNSTQYELPAATASVRGGIKVGAGLSISGDTLSAPYNPSGGYGPLIPTTSYWRQIPSDRKPPAGGTWAAINFQSVQIHGDNTSYYVASRDWTCNVVAGGTALTSAYGFCWRVR